MIHRYSFSWIWSPWQPMGMILPQPKATRQDPQGCWIAFPSHIELQKTVRLSCTVHKINPCLLSGPTHSVPLHHLIYSGYSHLVYFCTLSYTTDNVSNVFISLPFLPLSHWMLCIVSSLETGIKKLHKTSASLLF